MMKMDKDVLNYIQRNRTSATSTRKEPDVLIEKYAKAGLTTLHKRLEKERMKRDLCENHLAFHLDYFNIEGIYDKNFIKRGARAGVVPLKSGLFTKKALYLVKVADYIGDIPEAMVDVILENKGRYGSFYVGKPASYTVPPDPLLLATKEKTDFKWGGRSDLSFYVLGVWGDDWYDLDLRCLESTARTEK
jgi:hypothetical protein